MSPHAPLSGGVGADRGDLTWVDLVWYEGRIEHWIRFGAPVAEHILDRRRRRLGFAPGSVFAFVRWQAGDRGTVASRIVIVQTVDAGSAYATTPGVHPGGRLLLRIAGWPRVQRVLAAIDAIERLELEAREVAPDHWRQVHNRLSARAEPEPYTPLRHRAWRQRCELGAP
ncbi:MAG: DUF2840 domain-containing protein [Phenylobacterium sp.]|uniref:DUF2840 domain-containing protein n=1 Tax=Phenylobacterium sp. TaxID=1871053 RepID=UPI001A5EA5EF|nr:DUF2840 domain-containing protein [Phenylobacterium sp.]MBL8772199.1 DUF2840 domain-containing protein [Phenylobacterium sp.]